MNPALENLVTKNRQLESRVAILEGANELLKDEATVIDRENRSLKRDMDLELLAVHNLEKAKTKAVNVLSLELGLARTQLDLKQVEIAESRGRNENLRDSIAGFKVEQVKLREQIREAQPEVEMLKKDVKWAQEMLSAKLEENNGLYRKQRQLHEEIKTLGKANDCLCISRDECDAERKALKDEINKTYLTKTAAALHDTLLELNKMSGITFIIATHNREFAERANQVFEL